MTGASTAPASAEVISLSDERASIRRRLLLRSAREVAEKAFARADDYDEDRAFPVGDVVALHASDPAALRLHPEALESDPDEASFFLGRETPVPSLRPHLSAWQQRLYAFMTRNAVAAPDYFLIPPPRVVELGTRVEM